MKTNGRMDDGGQLKPECRAPWAQCFVRFIRAYEGVFGTLFRPMSEMPAAAIASIP